MSSRGHFTIDKVTGKLVPYVEEKREVNAPFVLTDEIPGGMRSMADRKIYTSKARYRHSLRQQGFVEVGNEKLPENKPRKKTDAEMRQLEADIAQSYTDVRDGNAPLSELDKERCKIVNKQIRESHDQRVRPDAKRD